MQNSLRFGENKNNNNKNKTKPQKDQEIILTYQIRSTDQIWLKLHRTTNQKAYVKEQHLESVTDIIQPISDKDIMRS